MVMRQYTAPWPRQYPATGVPESRLTQWFRLLNLRPYFRKPRKWRFAWGTIVVSVAAKISQRQHWFQILGNGEKVPGVSPNFPQIFSKQFPRKEAWTGRESYDVGFNCTVGHQKRQVQGEGRKASANLLTVDLPILSPINPLVCYILLRPVRASC